MFTSLPGVKTVKDKLEESINKLYHDRLKQEVAQTEDPYYKHKFNYTWTPRQGGHSYVIPMIRWPISVYVSREEYVQYQFNLMVDDNVSWNYVHKLDKT